MTRSEPVGPPEDPGRDPIPRRYRLLISLFWWSQWLRPRFYRYLWNRRVRKRSEMTARVQGHRMVLDLEHSGIGSVLAIRGVRERAHLELLRESLEPGMTVVDLGANIGYYVLEAARAVGPDGRVFAVEPDPRNFRFLERNVRENGYGDRVSTEALAMGEEDGTAELRLGHTTNVSTLVPLPGGEDDPGERVEVDVRSVDGYLADRGVNRLDFLRMDVEGFEVEIFRGMRRTLERGAVGMRILMEVHPTVYSENRDFESVLNDVLSSGFRAAAVVSAGEPRPPRFRRLGYRPDHVVFEDGFLRGVYRDIRDEDVGPLVCRLPHASRYLLLEKRDDGGGRP